MLSASYVGIWKLCEVLYPVCLEILYKYIRIYLYTLAAKLVVRASTELSRMSLPNPSS